MEYSSERAIISFEGSLVFLLCVSTEPREVFTCPGESLQLVSNN